MARFSLPKFLRETYETDTPESLVICGMDEVGRGAYAGPLVAAAVVLPPRFRHKLIKDSKQLTAVQREKMDALIRKKALQFAVAEISVSEINHFGLGWANNEIFRRLAEGITADVFLCDGRLNIGGDKKVHCIVGGDNLVKAISAASIIAKVHRDALMRSLHDQAPIYNWASNKGYGAAVHRKAIVEHGPHVEHRNVFVQNLMQLKIELPA